MWVVHLPQTFSAISDQHCVFYQSIALFRFIRMAAPLTHSDMHPLRLLPEGGSYHQRDAGVQKKMEAPAGGTVRCPEVSLLSHPVLWPFHLLISATLGAIAPICSPPPSTPHSHRIHRAQGGAGIDADWLIRAADVQHSGVWGWGDGYLCDAHIPFFPPPEFCA